MSQSYQEQWSQAPLATIPLAYLYIQYQDDPDLPAWIGAYNNLAQQYHEWFLSNPLSIYTGAGISGPLLDWVGGNLYGVDRPVVSSTGSNASFAAMNSQAMNSQAMNGYTFTSSGSAQSASDDLYKRTLTWVLYKGDGRQASIEWLRRRIARFLYGANGGDINVGLITNIGIGNTAKTTTGSYNTAPWNGLAWNSIKIKTFTSGGVLYIKIPNLTISQDFVDLFTSGYLPVPIQVMYKITIDP